ncbi:MAG TPA: hypothetical protein VFE51_23500 [Verrucomicrobiae bacterium]|nr:hypothetical protein [Verrucomicrobiae bacterium]
MTETKMDFTRLIITSTRLASERSIKAPAAFRQASKTLASAHTATVVRRKAQRPLQSGAVVIPERAEMNLNSLFDLILILSF